ncbi:LysR substrate-binding domain-containing protein [Salinifilum aidingensis]
MFDPVLLRTFLVVEEVRSFTQAGARLGVRQSTVSQQIRKLEQTAGRVLFDRDTHAVDLTSDGEALVGLAKNILDANERAWNYFAESDLRGRLRLGISEDFALTRLHEVLADFRRGHPLVDLELTVGLSGTLDERLQHDQLDLVLAKRRPGQRRGRLLWREQLVWIAAPGVVPNPGEPVPLILYPPPSITREYATETLERHGSPWRASCTCTGLSGLRAAALAGLGIAVHARSLIPGGLVEVPRTAGLPSPGEVEVVLLAREEAGDATVEALSAAILDNGDRLR